MKKRQRWRLAEETYLLEQIPQCDGLIHEEWINKWAPHLQRTYSSVERRLYLLEANGWKPNCRSKVSLRLPFRRRP